MHSSTRTLPVLLAPATMMAGLIASTQKQQVIGISTMKGNLGLEQQGTIVTSGTGTGQNFHIFHDYHFGGYAKHPPELIHYMNQLWEQHRLPTDIIYCKNVYAVEQMVTQSLIPPGSKILMIHTVDYRVTAHFPTKPCILIALSRIYLQQLLSI